MPNEQYLDTYGLNTFWSKVKTYTDAKINPTWVGYTSDQWQMTGTMIDVLFQIDLDKCSTTPKTGSYGMVIANGGNDAQGNDTSNYMMICKAESPPNPDSAVEGQQWVRVIYALELGSDTNLASGILLYASVADPIQKNHSTTMTKSGFIGPLPNINDAGYGLLTYDKKLYQVAYHVSSIDSDGLYTIIYDSDPLLIGPSESGGGGSTLLNSINHQLTIMQSKWTNVNGVYQCVIPCEGVVANEAVQNIYSTPAAFQQSDCEEHGVKCIAQGTDTLTYQAKTLPPDLLMYVTIVNASETTSDLVEWSPKMTSNTTPAPYVVTYNGLNAATSSNTAPFRMFQALPSQSQKPYFQTKTNSFIGIDFGSPIIIYGVSARYTDQQYMPSHYTIQGSSDGLTYFDLFKVVTDSNTSNSNFVRYYFSPVKYRYYRFQMDADTTAFQQTLTECSINSVRFLRLASDVEEVS